MLKLQLELETFNAPFAQELSQNLKPLSNLFIQRYSDFLPKLLYPIRVGTHANTAFGLSFAYDYSLYSKNDVFLKVIKENSIRLF